MCSCLEVRRNLACGLLLICLLVLGCEPAKKPEQEQPPKNTQDVEVKKKNQEEGERHIKNDEDEKEANQREGEGVGTEPRDEGPSMMD